MQVHGIISQFPKEIKLLITVFIITLSIGFYTSIRFVDDTSNSHPQGIEERYLGNEKNEEATTMQFKKSKAEMMTLVHNHILSLSVIFFILALLLSTTAISKKVKVFLMIEPFASIIFTFGGIYLMWSGIVWMKYIVLISGILMTVTFVASTLSILRGLYINKKS
jgi:hypothetical protein